MAEKTICISQQQTKPIKISKWKVSEGNTVSIGRVIFIYDFDGVTKPEQRKWKLSQAGTIHKILAQEGAIISPGEIVCELKECRHPTIMNDMCAECGTDLRKNDTTTTASVPMVHAIPDLKVSEELAQKLGKADTERLIKDRKLVLFVDLDQTLIHTTNDNIDPNIKDIYHFQLYGPNSQWYHTRLRPGTHQFLDNIFPYYELHICTFGARNYAHRVATYLDPSQKIFSNRILSRDECFDPTSKKANLKALFPCGDNMVCIIDDREDVWSNATNLIHVKPYHFFQHTGDINAPPGLDKQENDDKLGVELKKFKEKSKPEEESNNNNDKSQETKEEIKTNENSNREVEESKKEIEISETSNKETEETIEEIKTNESSNIETEEKKSESDEQDKQVPAIKNNGEHVEKELNGKNEDVKETSDVIPATNPEDTPEKKLEKQELEKPQSPKDNMIEIDDPDDYLLYLEDILKQIHRVFYEDYDKMESGEVPDLKKVIPNVRSKILKGCKLYFSGLVPTHLKLEQSKAYQIARSLGAEVTQDLEDDSTHLVALRPGTAKVHVARRRKNLKMVTPDWLWTCAERWEHVSELIFPLSSKGSKNRHPPPHCSSPEHIIDYPEHNTPALRKRTPSGRFMDTINPLMSFSNDDIADMDKEVEDILDDESDSSEEETPKETVPADVEEKVDDQNSSSTEESMDEYYPKGHKRKRKRIDIGEDSCNFTEDEVPSTKFRRGEDVGGDLDFEQQSSQESDGSIEAPDEVDDGEWNMMGAALEREFLSNN